ncbi:gamma-aminobutyric acid receptor subunit gamma-2 isoform X3 [Drosophila sulfurigaster albostrigata]|uniref:gamma-aminobutyric acid receptor subunit gamma-2 isoform X3 n=1 Tax=Drosophila sulfurigaster albostrigata TaxID=89887 RepID=UPI002D21ECC7|nr:gamma-aminobutyric acid receptor subunit gamma-2 isoform X3 [Drosophila sulfurigaster albostrigata]
MILFQRPLGILACFFTYIFLPLDRHWVESVTTVSKTSPEVEVASKAEAKVLQMPKMRNMPTMPTITSEFKASRIYESFRAVPNTSMSTSTSASPTDEERSRRLMRRYANETSAFGAVGASRLMRPRTASADMLSRNISSILENLLKRYEQSQLPTHGQGLPTVVRTNILIRSMGPVSELDMDYSMDCYFRQYWRDKRLSFQGPIKSLSLSIKMLDKIWRPDTYFYNGKHSHIHTITVPNKLLRLDQDGGILYSMRLTIKATCPMELKNFPMDRQSCPLIIGSYGYTNQQLVYEWQNHDDAVSFVPGMTLNQFDLISMMHRNFTSNRREGDFSVLHVAFNLKRHTGYFLIQVYVPCILIVVLSWVSFWIHREATSDRVGLCVTAVLTLSTISLDSRTDLPKVKYATALDWFLLMSFLYCIATLLEFAGVHYFTKLGSGEIPRIDDEWEDIGAWGFGAPRDEPADAEEATSDDSEPPNSDSDVFVFADHDASTMMHCDCDCELPLPAELNAPAIAVAGNRNTFSCPIYNVSELAHSHLQLQFLEFQLQNQPQSGANIFPKLSSHASTMERTTQTEPPVVSRMHQMWLCLKGDDKFRRQRERDAAAEKSNQGRSGRSYVNSISLIDRVARVAFPMTFALFNLLYWLAYGMYKKEFSWSMIKA